MKKSFRAERWLFLQLGGLVTSVLMIRAQHFGVNIRAPDVWKFPVLKICPWLGVCFLLMPPG